MMLQCYNCTGFHVNGVYMRNSPFVFINNFDSNDTLIENIELWAPGWSPNTAGSHTYTTHTLTHTLMGPAMAHE